MDKKKVMEFLKDAIDINFNNMKYKDNVYNVPLNKVNSLLIKAIDELKKGDSDLIGITHITSSIVTEISE